MCDFSGALYEGMEYCVGLLFFRRFICAAKCVSLPQTELNIVISVTLKSQFPIDISVTLCYNIYIKSKGGDEMTEAQINALVEAIRAALEGEVIDKIEITIKPKTTKQK